MTALVATILGDDGNKYHLYPSGALAAHNMATVRGWRFIAMVRYHHFGHEAERLALDAVLQRTPWEWNDLRWKNGRPRWRVMDRYRGTERVWNFGIVRIWRD